MDLPAWSPNCVELTKQCAIAGFMHTVKNSSRFLRVLEPTAEVGIAANRPYPGKSPTAREVLPDAP